jgi:Domain of unknown function (DUF397)
MDNLDHLPWRTSSHSGSNGGNCIEVATTPHTIAVRDSKNPDDATLVFARDSWQAFTCRTKTIGNRRSGDSNLTGG